MSAENVSSRASSSTSVQIPLSGSHSKWSCLNAVNPRANISLFIGRFITCLSLDAPRAVADGSHRGGRDKRAKAGDLPELPASCAFITNAFNLVGDRLDLGLCLLPLLPHAIQQPAQPRAQILFGIFDHNGQVLAQVNRLGRKGDTAFQQESANLVDSRSAPSH